MNIRSFFTILAATFALTAALVGCRTASDKQLASQTKADTTVAKIQKVEDVKQGSGRTFVYGTKLALDKAATDAVSQITNVSLSIDIARGMNNNAMLTLGLPSTAEALVITDIVTGLLSTNEVLKAKANALEAQLSHSIAAKEAEIDKLKSTLETQLDDVKKIAQANASKADLYNEEHSFWNSINPFYDLWRFLKKLTFLGLTIGALVAAVKLAGIFFPALGPIAGIIDSIFGGLVRWVTRVIPGVATKAGLVGTSVLASFKKVVKGVGVTMDTLKKEDIESALLDPFPNDKMFTKLEVRTLLEQHSINIDTLLSDRLAKLTNDEDRVVINKLRSEMGLFENH